MFHYIAGFGDVNIHERLQSAFQDGSLSHLELEGVIFDDEANIYLNQQLANKRLENLIFRNCQHPRIDYWAEIEILTLQASQPYIGRISIGDQLVELNLTSISFSEDLAASLGRQIGTHRNLQRLDISESRFLHDGPLFFARGLAANQTLEVVNFSECNLMDESIGQLVDALRHKQPLKNLDISFNKCRHAGVEALINLVGHKESLEELSLGFNAFGVWKRVELQPLFNALASSNSKLERLEVGGNGLNNGDIPHVMDMLCNNKSINSLDLSGNRISDSGIRILTARLRHVQGLRHLALEENSLTSLALGDLAQGLELNLSLEELELDEELVSEDTDRIQQSVQRLSYFLDLNWGGRRIVQQQSALTASIWPVLLARSNQAPGLNLSRNVKPHDVAYYILQEIASLLV